MSNKILADLDFLYQRIVNTHPNPFHSQSKEQWRNDYHTIISSWDDKDDWQQIGALFQLIALLNDSHSRISFAYQQSHDKMSLPPHSVYERKYPIELMAFADGIYLTKTTDNYVSSLGKQVTAIANLPFSEVMKKLLPFLPTENLMGQVQYVLLAIQYPFFLYCAGIIENKDQPLSLTINSQAIDIASSPESKDLIDCRSKESESPIYQDRTQHLISKLEEEILYVRLSTIQNREDLTIKQFTDQLDQQLVENSPKIMVIDIRDNGGGNNFLNQPLIELIIRHPAINDIGNLYGIINRNTFSAAINLAIDMERFTWALFVGEPFMAPINHYGDPEKFTLPHTGLIVRISTLYWQNSEPQDRRTSIYPDLPLYLKFNQYVNNEDPVLEMIRTFEVPEGWEEFPSQYTARMKIGRSTQRGNMKEFFPWL